MNNFFLLNHNAQRVIIYSKIKKDIIYKSEPFFDYNIEISDIELKNNKILLNLTLIMEDEEKNDYKKIEITLL